MHYKTLPAGYRYAGSMDFLRNRKQIKAVLILSAALVFLPVLGGLAVLPTKPFFALMAGGPLPWLALAGLLILYIPLHELTHGVVMYALSGVRPSYGLKLPYAYAGSTVWFDRRSHILTALAPVVVWGILFLIGVLRAPEGWRWLFWIAQISNLSGSAGDLYCALALARMPGDLLIQDTGVRMRIMKRI